MRIDGVGPAPWLVIGAALVMRHGRLGRRYRELERVQAFTESIGGQDPLEGGLAELRRALPAGVVAIATIASEGHVALRSCDQNETMLLRVPAGPQPTGGAEIEVISSLQADLFGVIVRRLGGRRGLAYRSGPEPGRTRWVIVVDQPGVVDGINSGARRVFAAAAPILDVRLRSSGAWAYLESATLLDPVTGLANRRSLESAIDERWGRDVTTGAILSLSLQGFAAVNDSLGHRFGDDLLRAVAARIGNQIRNGDLAARLDRDEFAVLFDDFPSGAELERRVGELAAQVDQPVDLDGVTIELRSRIGLVRRSEPTGSGRELLRLAAVARADATAERPWAFHQPSDHGRSASGRPIERLTLGGELREAVDGHQLEIHLQAQVRTSDRSLVGAEALLRWNHPTEGLVSPGAFLPPTEYSSIAPELTRQALTATVEAAARLQSEVGGLVLWMNLTSRDLLDHSLPTDVEAALAAHDLGGSRLGFEVTESSLIGDIDAAIAGLAALRRLGCRTSIDDFGTGFASLRYVQRLPIDEVKIDRSFVARAAVRPDDAAIVRSTTKLMHDLGLAVVAEGVEDEATIELMCEIGCDIIQGFAVGRPLPVDEFLAIASQCAGPWPCG